MSSHTTLHHVPREISAQIFSPLSVADLKSLRLVNRQLNALATGPCFARYTTSLTPRALARTEEFMGHQFLGHLPCHLRIVAECTSSHFARRLPGIGDGAATGEAIIQQADPAYDMALEGRVLGRLANILTWGGRMSLTTLELDARFIEGPDAYSAPADSEATDLDRQRLWARASQTYRLTMTALAQCRAPIRDLQIYSNTYGCSVPSYDISVGLPRRLKDGLAQLGHGLKHLSLSYSTRVDHGWERLPIVYGPHHVAVEKRRQRRYWDQIGDEVEWHEMDGVAASEDMAPVDFDMDGSDYDTDDEADGWIQADKGSEIRGRYSDSMPQALCEDNFPGVALFLKQTPNIESLDLHMFQTLEYEAYDGASRLHFYSRVFKAMVDQNLELPRLRRLTLRGVCVNGDDLVAFMRRHPQVESLELHHVILCCRRLYAQLRSWKDVLREVCHPTITGKDNRSLVRVFCTDLCRAPGAGTVPTTSAGHLAENLLGATEHVTQHWIDKGWCDCPRKGTRPILHTREFLQDDFRREDIFDQPERGMRLNTNEWNKESASPTAGQLRAHRERMYGKTYG
ncbi:hypothetical protein O9K51_00106 [Purpureocillium lavendulum]|uniref:F-box domain-containing protein n=1 Tax=Purpureocillium lavendulum TaxID=1247861 RepID=A0AB34G129_9HYPO|nr:hypothetical protein O9K51_00106 [Purpureocillium lavendulum]